jgi:hypothetical protein
MTSRPLTEGLEQITCIVNAGREYLLDHGV